jgi:hypothetical protein
MYPTCFLPSRNAKSSSIQEDLRTSRFFSSFVQLELAEIVALESIEIIVTTLTMNNLCLISFPKYH